ncbi:BTAD domain-containing putative transcriptional regulator [Dactylosporangium sp. NPDC005572]|uniref:AfsR/SARP family transcriptional regulator n=1 Tax=Dactylosporangium sp. NPDC005572 TaxID=3156889 RepID=UPI0033AD09BC
MDVEFRVLGPVEAHYRDTPLQLGGPKQRTVLALLLLHPGRPVPVSRVVDELWPHHAPSSATPNAISYLSGLRRVLADAGCALERRTVGYVLDARPESVDLQQFLSHEERGNAAWNAGDPVAAAQHWERALATWRGHAFEGLRIGPALDAVRAELGERQPNVLERLARAKLRLGADTDTIAGLRRHVLAEPLRESGWLLLVAAAWFAGNPAAAIEAYEQARDVLAEQLGVGPGPGLRAMHQAVLAADDDAAWALLDPAAAAPAPGRATATLSVPAQLPLDVHGFAGRVDQLARLDAVFDNADAHPTAVVISAVSGTAGVGKTALALHWAHRRAEQFPDGQLYVNLRGFDPDDTPTEPAKAVRGFLDALGVPAWRIPTSLDAQTALYRSHIAGRRMLVVLDNGRDAEQVRALLPGSPSCLVLVTSRNRMADLVALDGAQPLMLDVLDLADARQLLANRLGEGRVAAEPDAVDEIVTRCAQLPLALSIVAARAATNPRLSLAMLAGQLRDEDSALDVLAGESPKTDVRSVFSWSYRELGPEAARLFRLLGRHPGSDIGVLAAASLAGVPAAAVRPMLAELTRAGLLMEPVSGRYAFHDLLRAYATELAGTQNVGSATSAALHRLLEHYLHSTAAAAGHLDAFRQPLSLGPPAPGALVAAFTGKDQAMEWFTAEYRTLMACVSRATQLPEPDLAAHPARVAHWLRAFQQLTGRWSDGLALHRIAVTAAQRHGNRLGEGLALDGIAWAQAYLGDPDAAEAAGAHAASIYRDAGLPVAEAHAYGSIAHAMSRAHRHAEALEYARRQAELCAEHGDPADEARSLNTYGSTLADLGRPADALDPLNRALALQLSYGDNHGPAFVLDSLGLVHLRLGRLDEAEAHYRRSLELFERAGHRYNMVCPLSGLGDVFAARDDPGTARDMYRQARILCHEFDGHHRASELDERLANL